MKSNDTMQALVLDKEKILSVNTVEVPAVESGTAIVKVAYTGICGSDLFHLSGDNERAVLPLIAGHEISGEIVASDTSAWDLGDTVTVFPALSCGTCEQCRKGNYQLHRPLRMIGIQTSGGFAEYVKVPQKNLIPLPKDLSLKRGALAEPMAVAVHGFKLAAPRIGDSALIIGAGPIGLLLAGVAKTAGCDPIFITEKMPSRVKMARKLGFNCIDIDNDNYKKIIHDVTGGRGVDLIYECVGHPSTVEQIVEVGAIRSKVVIVGAFHKGGAQMDLFAMSKLEQTMVVSWQYDFEDFIRGIKLLNGDFMPVENLITHIISLNMVEDALDLMRKGEAMKVLVEL